MDSLPLLRNVSVVTAGAGTGKTYRITSEIINAVAAGLSAEALLATTFTRKAAAELQERIQAGLAKAGHRNASIQLPEALIGTVNSVCGRLLSEFALEAGLSPDLAVLDDNAEAAAFQAAVSAEVAAYEDDVRPAAWRLGFAGGDQDGDWVEIVRRIAQAARSNQLAPGDVLACVPRALAGVEALLSPSDPAGEEALDRALAGAMDVLLKESANWGLADGPKNTRDAVERVRLAATSFDPGNGRFLPWSEWVALSKLKPAVKRADAFAPLGRAADAQDRHPRLRADIRMLVTTCYQAASRALGAYAAHKAREGLLDFCDQEATLLDLLERDATVREELATRVSLLFVDEFQDTSPLQLALFLRLARLAPRSVWVGDPKQAIYGFRGTDPDLMGVVLRVLGSETGGAAILNTSRRSRPGLVAFANALFVPALAMQGMDAAHVALQADRTDLPDHGPPLLTWRLPKGKADETCAALAGAVASTLANPARPRVQDRSSGALRPLRAGDVAILCKTNTMVADLAEALRAQGLRAAAAREGLLETPEVQLALACLRRLASGGDSLAAAEIAHLCDPAGGGGWLAMRLADRTADLDPRVTRLDAARPRAADLPPVASLGEALAEADVLRVVSAWPDSAQRLANIEALFAYAGQYEHACRSARGAATPGGLVAWLHALDPAPSQPASFGEDAVAVLTYHRAKGLEWPFVVMTQLGHERGSTAFEVAVEARADEFDLADPLAGRWVRFWPWPYGRQSAGVPMGERAAICPEQAAAESRANAEAVRLGYVGVTRARDYLVLALDSGKPRWLEQFAPGLAASLNRLPCGETDLTIGETQVRVMTTDIPLALAAAEPSSQARVSLVWPEGAAPVFLPARTSPSRLVGGIVTPEPEMVVLGTRLGGVGGDARDAVGDALHRFLAADDPALPPAARQAIAVALLRAWRVDDALQPEDCLIAADRLWTFVRERYGVAAQVLREWPVRQCLANGSELRGRIDLLIRHVGGIAVIDHKSFPGSDAKARATTYLPQLCGYADALRAAGGTVSELVVHLPILGRAAVFRTAR
jgi:ATP-dependent helicase/nuclease subunit A